MLKLSQHESENVKRLVACLGALGSLDATPSLGRASASYDHIGAKLSDAVLQSGVRYEAFVRPRVDHIAQTWPSATTTSSFLKLLRSEGPNHVLNLKGGRKLRTIVELAQFFVDHDVETTDDLRRWLQIASSASSLRTVYGVGPKTVSFLKLLVGLNAVAVDRQVLRFVKDAGVDLKDPDLVEGVLTTAGKQLGLSGGEVDQLVWRSMAKKGRQGL